MRLWLISIRSLIHRTRSNALAHAHALSRVTRMMDESTEAAVRAAPNSTCIRMSLDVPSGLYSALLGTAEAYGVDMSDLGVMLVRGGLLHLSGRTLPIDHCYCCSRKFLGDVARAGDTLECIECHTTCGTRRPGSWHLDETLLLATTGSTERARHRPFYVLAQEVSDAVDRGDIA